MQLLSYLRLEKILVPFVRHDRPDYPGWVDKDLRPGATIAGRKIHDRVNRTR
ncbi:MAG: hypothetical protein JXA41_12285 [Deltaproteobacteria bacterium]|nr:hypothetical protein [Deltaproteobacteria bacterium]